MFRNTLIEIALLTAVLIGLDIAALWRELAGITLMLTGLLNVALLAALIVLIRQARLIRGIDLGNDPLLRTLRQQSSALRSNLKFLWYIGLATPFTVMIAVYVGAKVLFDLDLIGTSIGQNFSGIATLVLFLIYFPLRNHLIEKLYDAPLLQIEQFAEELEKDE